MFLLHLPGNDMPVGGRGCELDMSIINGRLEEPSIVSEFVRNAFHSEFGTSLDH